MVEKGKNPESEKTFYEKLQTLWGDTRVSAIIAKLRKKLLREGNENEKKTEKLLLEIKTMLEQIGIHMNKKIYT